MKNINKLISLLLTAICLGGQSVTALTANDSIYIDKIAFDSDRDGSRQVYIMNIDGSGLQQITDSPDDKLDARLSPDGKKIVYARFAPGGMSARIHLVNSDGTGDICLTRIGTVNGNPCWSAEGTRIFFQTNRFGNCQIYQTDANGKNQITLSKNTGYDVWPNTIRKSVISGFSDMGNLLNESGLKNIWPNPAGDLAHIGFTLRKPGHVDTDLIDQAGRTAPGIVDENVTDGDHLVKADLNGLSSGIYTIVMNATNHLTVKKFVKY